MDIEGHVALARRIESSLQKCGEADYEMTIEAAMLAGTHWLNALLHKLDATPPQQDVFHSYLLTVNEFRRLAVAAEKPLAALAAIEDSRAPFVRGCHAGGEAAAERALALLSQIRAAALGAM
ncbi:hypothetical protein [Cupriavidus sp. UYPR2.512]|uniref:hypothetical protein n=1 Tax=Cupriavidus sp. UYPR2.512 TaxID=1080187 RepID=UPI000379807B|nr:hypothetical protein [Cupriavidus sp. UYPR2.512]UIF84574.1 hypothetical protein KAF44_09660 [Cupriavidus necator]